MGKTICEVYHCAFNSQSGLTMEKPYSKTKPHCTKANRHVDRNGLCLDKTIKARKHLPISFKATPRIPRKININFCQGVDY